MKKNFIEIYTVDMEGRNGKWKTTEMTYEVAVANLNPCIEVVREIEKTFNEETFEITVKEIKRTEKVYKGFYWKGETKEIIA